MKLHFYVSDSGDGSYAIMVFDCEEDRAKQERADEARYGYSLETIYTPFDTEFPLFDTPDEIEVEEE